MIFIKELQTLQCLSKLKYYHYYDYVVSLHCNCTYEVSGTPNRIVKVGTTVQSHSNWLQNFQVPKHFLTRTMMALNSGDKSSITSSVRKEIIAAVSTLVMVHVTYPTSDEYSHICEFSYGGSHN